MNLDWNENHAELIGEAMTEPAFSHQSHGEDYFLLPVRSKRLSGNEDGIHVMLSRTLLDTCPIHPGSRVAVEGQVRSYNNHSGVGSRLVITLLAQRITQTAAERDENRVQLAGVLCKAPVYRRTPLGREIADLILAVNRRCGRADYLPCIAWGALARQCTAMAVGEGLSLSGRLQSRAYSKVTEGGTVKKIAFEVSIMTMELVEMQTKSHAI